MKSFTIFFNQYKYKWLKKIYVYNKKIFKLTVYVYYYSNST